MSPCEGPPYYGKYRGKVTNNIDLTGLGKVQVTVPNIVEDAWAMPCFPGAGPGVGLFAIPPDKANVWVEFEAGDPDYPVYSGGFWDLGDAPAPMGPTQISTRVWAGDNFKLEILDMAGLGGLILSVTTASGDAVLSADGTAMKLEFAGSSVSLDATGVTVNNGNLKVLP